MVSKVFALRSGSKPVVLPTKSDQSALRDKYKGDLVRLPITNATDMIYKLADDDEDAIIRTWDLLCVETVLNPRSGNMMCLEYIGSIADPKKTDEYAWDEHILDIAMQHVEKLQQKKKEPLAAVEGKSDYEFWISGPLPLLAVPARFKYVYEKHKVIFATEVDSTLKTLGAGLKFMQSQRMACLLTGVDAAMKECDGPSVVFQPSNGTMDNDKESAELSEKEAGDDQVDSHDQQCGNDTKTEAGAAKMRDGQGSLQAEDVDVLTNTSSAIPDVPQQAIVTDSGRLVAGSADDEDVSSHVRDAMLPPLCAVGK
ncbi:unnamed protein product [Alopecurus aequalis]